MLAPSKKSIKSAKLESNLTPSMTSIQTIYLRFTIVTLLYGFTCSLSGQSFEYLFSNGFGSDVREAKKLTSGDWVLAVMNNGSPGGFYGDTLSLIFLDSVGTFSKRVVVDPPFTAERFDFLWMDISPQDEIIVGFAGGDCDVADHTLNLVLYDSEGYELWSKRNMDVTTPEDYYWSNTYGILLVKDGTLYCLSPDDGELRWQLTFGTAFPSRPRILSDAADVLYYESNMIHLARLDSINGHLQYVVQVSNEMNFDWDLFQFLQNSPWHSLYSYSKTLGGIVRINDLLDISQVIPLPDPPQQILIDQGKIWILTNQIQPAGGLKSQLFEYDTSGLLLRAFEPLARNTWAEHITFEDSFAIVNGFYHSGTHFITTDQLIHAIRFHGWIKRAPLDVLAVPVDSFNVAITAAIQDSEIFIDSNDLGPFIGYVYSYYGGDFSFEVTNLGIKPVYAVWINTGFDYQDVGFVCSLGADTKKVLYQDIELQPGESTWLHFGDIHASYQPDYPSEFCFWTSGPNNTPDLVPEDDVYCSGFIVPVSEPTTSSFHVFPNPSNGIVNIEIPDEMNDLSWRIVDITGRVYLNGVLPGDPGLQSLDIDVLNPGMYFLQLGHTLHKMIIEK